MSFVQGPPTRPPGGDRPAFPSVSIDVVTGLVPTGGPVLLSSDDFNRANGPVGSSDGNGLLDPILWVTQLGTFQIAGNQLAVTVAPGTITEHLFTPFVDLSALHVVNDVNGQGIIVRWLDNNNFVQMTGDNTQCVLAKVVGGAPVGMIATFGILAAGTVMRVTVDSLDVYNVYLDGDHRGTVIDSFNNSATRHGLRMQGNAQRFDNWQAFKMP